MSDESILPSDAAGLCPTCLEPVPGQYLERDGSVVYMRDCPDHGRTSRIVWNSVDHWEWARPFGPEPISEKPPAESERGLIFGKAEANGDTEFLPTPELTVQGDHVCLAVIEITDGCNLECSYCFASSGPDGADRSIADIRARLETVLAAGGPRPIQFSGGEPTTHSDLPELVELAREMGFEHIEVNTNGIHLARRNGYAERLADAGVTAIYLQFDGLSREANEQIRDADLRSIKRAAVEACRETDLPVILVPTVVPGINDDEMGSVVEFALDNLDIIQAVNFQPVAHFGRFARHHGRFSLDEAARRLSNQLEALELHDFLPVPCCSAYCQLSTAVMPDDGGIIPLTGLLNLEEWDSISGLIDERDWMELLAGTQAGSACLDDVAGCCGFDIPNSLEVLPISITGFMDADTADADRLANCCIAVPTADGELAPFCGYNMTTADGRYALRNRHGWGGRESVGPDDIPPDNSAPLRADGTGRKER